MIEFASQNDFMLEDEKSIKSWIVSSIEEEGRELGELGYVFCDDDFLHKLNLKYLDHDTLTDVISFDYTEDNVVGGEIYISTQRVAENASQLDIPFEEELLRVMIHGVLHLCGFTDKTEREKKQMRGRESYYLAKRGR